MLGLPNELAHSILTILDPESRFSLGITSHHFYALYRTERFPAYHFMTTSVPTPWQRLEAVAREGTIAQQLIVGRVILDNCRLSNDCPVGLLGYGLVKKMMRYNMAACIRRYFSSCREANNFLSAARGMVVLSEVFPGKIIDEWVGKISRYGMISPIFELYLTSCIHGRPTNIPIFHSMHGPELLTPGTRHSEEQAHDWITYGCLNIVVAQLRACVLGCSSFSFNRTTFEMEQCPGCPLETRRVFPLLMLAPDIGTPIRYLDVDFKIRSFKSISAGFTYACCTCATYHIRCPECEHFSSFVQSAEDVEFFDCDRKFKKLVRRADACLVGLPFSCARLSGKSDQHFNWRCTVCSLIFWTNAP